MNIHHLAVSPTRAQFCVPSLLVATFWVLFIVMIHVSPVIAGKDTIRIVIDTNEQTLKVFQGNKETLHFANIAIGRYGATIDRRKGDHKTPLGRFTIAWITDATSFHRLFGLLYPGKEQAIRALQAGVLDQRTWKTINQALSAGRLPPQNTVLGGNLGIHGIGKGDKNIHEQFNWTNGCVALTNEQIDLLSIWVRKGTSVEIR